MRPMFAVFAALALAACGADAADPLTAPAASAERLGPNDFPGVDPDCLEENQELFEMYYDYFNSTVEATRDSYHDSYRAARNQGASQQQLQRIKDEALEVIRELRAERDAQVSSIVYQTCGYGYEVCYGPDGEDCECADDGSGMCWWQSCQYDPAYCGYECYDAAGRPCECGSDACYDDGCADPNGCEPEICYNWQQQPCECGTYGCN